MQRSAETIEPVMIPGVVVRRWDRERDHRRIRAVYGAAFGHEPWPDDWDAFDQFDPDGVFVAEISGDAAGFVICFRRGDYGYISVVGVVPEHRRRGIASALVGRAVGYLRSLGVHAVRIDVYVDAPAAVATYRSLGFRVYETAEDDHADPRRLAEE
jgi:ribosomal-protein-alanine N-acetyltransferase